MFSKKSSLFIALFLISFVLIIIGSFLDREGMKSVVLGLVLISVAGIVLGKQSDRFLSNNELKLSSANAVSKSFLFLLVYFCAVFIFNTFLSPIPNPDFAIVGAMFLTLFLVRFYTLKDVENYIGVR